MSKEDTSSSVPKLQKRVVAVPPAAVADEPDVTVVSTREKPRPSRELQPLPTPKKLPKRVVALDEQPDSPVEEKPKVIKTGDGEVATKKPVKPSKPDGGGTTPGRNGKEDLSDLAALPKVRGKRLGSYDPLIDSMIQAAERLPAHAQNYGVELYAQVTPFSNDPNSPVRNAGRLSFEYRAAQFKAMRPIFNAAKFIFDSVSYALQAGSKLGGETFASSSSRSLTDIQSEMSETMRELSLIEAALLDNPESKVGPLPRMPDMTEIPVRLWAGSETKILPPELLTYVPSELVLLSLDVYQRFSALGVQSEQREFQRGVSAHLVRINEDIRRTYTDVVGFIDDLMLGFAEVKRGTMTLSEVLEELRKDAVQKAALLQTRLKEQNAEYFALEDKAQRIPRLRVQAGEDVAAIDDLKELLAGHMGLRYQLRGHVGDTGGLAVFWDFVNPTLKDLAKTLQTLPSTADLRQFVGYERDPWERVRAEYVEAAAKWETLRKR